MFEVTKIFLVLVVGTLISSSEGRYYEIVNPFICRPGSSFRLDCNRCTCGPTPGSPGACTRMGCVLKPDECIPGSYFQIDGQLCECPECGFKWHSNCFRSNYCNC